MLIVILYHATDKKYVYAIIKSLRRRIRKLLAFELRRDRFSYVSTSHLQVAKFISETGYYRDQNIMSCKWFLQFPHKIFVARATAKRCIHGHSIRSINSKATKSRSLGIRVNINEWLHEIGRAD